MCVKECLICQTKLYCDVWTICSTGVCQYDLSLDVPDIGSFMGRENNFDHLVIFPAFGSAVRNVCISL